MWQKLVRAWLTWSEHGTLRTLFSKSKTTQISEPPEGTLTMKEKMGVLLCESSLATPTEYHRVGKGVSSKLFSHTSGICRSTVKVLARLVSSEASFPDGRWCFLLQVYVLILSVYKNIIILDRGPSRRPCLNHLFIDLLQIQSYSEIFRARTSKYGTLEQVQFSL